MRVLGAVLALAVAAVVATIAVMNHQQSPADVARDRQPPIVRPVTVKVTKQILEVSFRDPQASYRFSDPHPITLATSLAKAGASQIVTRAPKPGQVLLDNQVFMSVAGRPVIVVQVNPLSANGQPCIAGAAGASAAGGAGTSVTNSGNADDACSVVPMYRDLRTGDRGPDVAQLQAVLKRLGFFTADVDGRFETSTSTAIAAWYEGLNLDPFGPNRADGADGAMIPANELVFASELPARVDEVVSETGAALGSSAALTVTGMQLVVASQISVDQVEYVAPGTIVDLIDQKASTTKGTVISVATKPGGTASDGRYAVEIATSTTNVPIGTVVTVSYPIKRSAQPLLAVPVTGLYPCAASQQGTECIHIAIGDGSAFSEMVVKRIMTSSSGLAGVEQATDSLKEGQVVLINRQDASVSDALPGPEDLGQSSSRQTVPASTQPK
jgi:peptidoglycan hydrolase-like protein with peptidoglycan-binding domain